jgi:kynurenine formamidase
MPTLIDLTTPLENRALSEPTFAPEFESPPRIEYFSHARGAEECESLFGCSRDELPNGLGWSVEVVHAIVHTATHCDSPWHYSPVTDGGKTRSMTIDEVPLDWYYGPGVILDMTHKGPEEPIEPDDVQQALDKIDYEVEENDIVLFRTDGYKLWGKQAYLTHFPGMTKAGAEYLIDRGVRVMGVDAYNFDMPFATQKRLYEETGDASVIEPCHMALGFERNYAHIEKLANLDKVPRPSGFTFSALPIKIKGASGAWCRAVAILDDDE